MKNFTELKPSTQKTKITSHTYTDKKVTIVDSVPELNKYEAIFLLDLALFDKSKRYQKEIKISKWSDVEVSFNELKTKYIEHVIENGKYLK